MVRNKCLNYITLSVMDLYNTELHILNSTAKIVKIFRNPGIYPNAPLRILNPCCQGNGCCEGQIVGFTLSLRS